MVQRVVQVDTCEGRMSTETYFKIRDKTTGLFSTGGESPGWSKTGKKWSKPGHITTHLGQVRMVRRGYRRTAQDVHPYVNAEVVTFEAKPVEALTEDVSARLAAIQKKKADKEARVKARRVKAKEDREREQLARLQAKYPNG